jgi:phosphate transport system substrate-binding protein
MGAVIFSGCEGTRQQTASSFGADSARPVASGSWNVDAAPTPVAAPPPAPTPDAASSMIATYQAETVLSGRLRSVGSDTMDHVMQLWEKDFQHTHGNLRFFHEGKGSSTAIPALIEGQSDFGPMSRAVKDKEAAEFAARHGYPPTVFRVAVDALAVYLHPSNPLATSGLTFEQLDAIFSSTRTRGHAEDITTWGQLRLTGEWANAPIQVYSRNSASGTYGFFKEHVLNKGDYKTTNRELVGSEAVVAAVAADKFAIGYSGIGYKTADVATAPLAVKAGERMFPAEGQYTYSGQYPLARFLYLTINRAPGSTPSDLQREFLRYIYSHEGQDKVTEAGFFPLSPEIVAVELAKLK